MLPALVLIPLTIGLSAFDRMGVDVFTPSMSVTGVRTVAELQPDYRSGTGTALLDLSGLDMRGRSRTASVEAAVGDIVVRVPQNVSVTVDAETGVGSIDVLGMETAGGLDDHRVFGGSAHAAGGSLDLRLRDGIGSIHVVQEGS